MISGILPIIKPAGMTSASAVLNARIILGESRIGHSGTLDPNAAGVLPIALGRATRLIEYMDAPFKTYRCECTLGTVTATDDIWAEPVGGARLDGSWEGMKKPSERELGDVLGSFLGESFQMPPAYSSVRVNGRHLYQYARSGQEVEVRPRRVEIRRMELISYDAEKGTFLFDIDCSRGTYVRTVCREIGERLGTGACMSCLIRTSCCGFSIDECVTFEQLAASAEPKTLLLPAERAAEGLQRLEIASPFHERLFCGGNPVSFEKARVWAPEGLPEGEPAAVFGLERGFLGVAAKAAGEGGFVLKPVKITYDGPL